MNNDIVDQLREEGFITHMARLPRESKILHAAADEIERLSRRLIELENIIDSSLDGIPSLQASIDSMSDEITMLAKERDEARREVCYLAAELDMLNRISISAESVALEYGWDCFKEEADYNNEYFRTHHK